MTVDQLEDAGFDGYSNVFGEDEKIAITAQLQHLNTPNILFEEAFNTISFSAIFSIDFSNPLNPDFLSATASVAIRGSLALKMTENNDFALNLIPE